MPQLDKATFDHQLITVSLSLFAIYLTLSLLVMPKVLANILTRKKYFSYIKSSLPKYYLANFMDKYREEKIFFFLLESFESKFFKFLNSQYILLSQTEIVKSLIVDMVSHFREEYLEVQLESKAFQRFL